jgi:hypothetical protein
MARKWMMVITILLSQSGCNHLPRVCKGHWFRRERHGLPALFVELRNCAATALGMGGWSRGLLTSTLFHGATQRHKVVHELH